jgi:hypothetical protein
VSYTEPDGNAVDFGLVTDAQYHTVPALDVCFPDLPPVLVGQNAVGNLFAVGELARSRSFPAMRC